jgi:tetratricopeptide (TPR) repeat protein
MKRWAKAALFLIVLAGCGVFAVGRAAATQNDARLAPLFERLKSSVNPQEAQLVEVLIWQVWAESGDPASDSLMALGVQTMQMGNLPGALDLFDAVTTRKPDFAEGWNKRATVLYLMGAYEASARDVDKTLALEPRHFGALSGLGLINMALERDEAAVAAFEAALKIHPYLPGVKINLETLRKRANQRGRAI